MVEHNFSSVTELPGSPATREQMERLYHRYRFAAEHCGGKRVLEVACGSGIGLGYLARTASLVIGGDYTSELLSIARSHYGNRVPLLRLDGQKLPFRDDSFDVVIMMEAIYYLPNAEIFVAESLRVLNKGGLLVLSTVNKDWKGLSPSTFSTRYFSIRELHNMILRRGFNHVMFYGGFPDSSDSLNRRTVALIRRVAAELHLVPKSLKGRERLKRLFYGPLQQLPPEVVPDMAALPPYDPLDASQSDSLHKIIYLIAQH